MSTVNSCVIDQVGIRTEKWDWAFHVEPQFLKFLKKSIPLDF